MAESLRIARSRVQTRQGMSKMRRQEIMWFYITITPWLIGFVFFTAGPFIASFVLSLTRYDVVNPAQWIGLTNYTNLFSDPLFWGSLRVTFTYAVLSLPLGLGAALGLAMLLNLRLPLLGVLRTVIYLPNIVSGVAVSMLWMWLLNPQFGLINLVLYQLFGITGPQWLLSDRWVIPSFVLMSLWNVGGPMLIFLAGLQGVPTELYEAAQIDGATGLRRFWNITLPMISPVFLFVLITSMIDVFQFFTPAYVMTNGGPDNQSLFYALYLYNNGLVYFRMGYASAMAWILFLIIFACTYVALRVSGRLVYYQGSEP